MLCDTYAFTDAAYKEDDTWALAFEVEKNCEKDAWLASTLARLEASTLSENAFDSEILVEALAAVLALTLAQDSEADAETD